MSERMKLFLKIALGILFVVAAYNVVLMMWLMATHRISWTWIACVFFAVWFVINWHLKSDHDPTKQLIPAGYHFCLMLCLAFFAATFAVHEERIFNSGGGSAVLAAERDKYKHAAWMMARGHAEGTPMVGCSTLIPEKDRSAFMDWLRDSGAKAKSKGIIK